MFKAIKRLEKKISGIDEHKMLSSILNEKPMRDEIIRLNQEQLYVDGVQADGEPTGEYSFNTIHGTKHYAGKIEKGQPYDHVTLKDAGKFYRSMKVEVEEEGMRITADDPNGLEEKWPQMLGLDSESKAQILPDIKGSIISRIIKRLKGKSEFPLMVSAR